MTCSAVGVFHNRKVLSERYTAQSVASHNIMHNICTHVYMHIHLIIHEYSIQKVYHTIAT